jgi:hypothetical protein
MATLPTNPPSNPPAVKTSSHKTSSHKTSSKIPAGVALTLNGLQTRAERLDIRGLRFDPTVRYVSPALLKPNPLNTELFDNEPNETIEALAEDIRVNGIHDALLVKSDNTLLTGHNRLRAALTIALAVVPVRYLLDSLDGAAETRFMVADNLLRRHLTTEQKMMLYRYLYGNDFLQRMVAHGGKRTEKTEERTSKGRSDNGRRNPENLRQAGQVERLNLNNNLNNNVKDTAAESIDTETITAARIARDTGQSTTAVQRQLYDWRKKTARTSEQNESHSPRKRTGASGTGTNTTTLSHALPHAVERTATRLIQSSLEEIVTQLSRADLSEEWKAAMRTKVERRLRRL